MCNYSNNCTHKFVRNVCATSDAMLMWITFIKKNLKDHRVCLNWISCERAQSLFCWNTQFFLFIKTKGVGIIPNLVVMFFCFCFVGTNLVVTFVSVGDFNELTLGLSYSYLNIIWVFCLIFFSAPAALP